MLADISFTELASSGQAAWLPNIVSWGRLSLQIPDQSRFYLITTMFKDPCDREARGTWRHTGHVERCLLLCVQYSIIGRTDFLDQVTANSASGETLQSIDYA